MPLFVDEAAQTDWKYPRNACTQYEARTFSKEEIETIENDPKLRDFIQSVIPRLVRDNHGVQV